MHTTCNDRQQIIITAQFRYRCRDWPKSERTRHCKWCMSTKTLWSLTCRSMPNTTVSMLKLPPHTVTHIHTSAKTACVRQQNSYTVTVLHVHRMKATGRFTKSKPQNFTVSRLHPILTDFQNFVLDTLSNKLSLSRSLKDSHHTKTRGILPKTY